MNKTIDIFENIMTFKDDYFEFVFSVEYKTTNIYGKEKIKHTHWHPQDFF